MDFLSTLPKTIIDLVLGVRKLRSDDRTRQRLADLVARVAACISDIGDAIERGEHPTALCAELDAYIANIEDFVQEVLGAEESRRLTVWLRHVGDVPGLAKIDVTQTVAIENRPKRSRQERLDMSERVREIAGTIRGAANLIRV